MSRESKDSVKKKKEPLRDERGRFASEKKFGSPDFAEMFDKHLDAHKKYITEIVFGEIVFGTTTTAHLSERKPYLLPVMLSPGEAVALICLWYCHFNGNTKVKDDFGCLARDLAEELGFTAEHYKMLGKASGGTVSKRVNAVLKDLGLDGS
jgi:hypothetical protein